MQGRKWLTTGLWVVGALLSLVSAALILFMVLSAVRFPLELEVRESPIWLHILALRAGINVFLDQTHIFISMSHGPMDTILKAGISVSMPFLSSHVVTRIFVLGVPLALWTTHWLFIRKRIEHPAVWATLWTAGLYAWLNGLPGTITHNLLVGRSDATALFFFVILIILSELRIAQHASILLRGMLEGLLLGICALTNTRFTAAVGAYYLYVLLKTRFLVAPPRRALVKRLAGSILSLSFLGLAFLVIFFKGDVRSYYSHFFGVFLDPGGFTLFPIAAFEWFPSEMFSNNRTPLVVLWLTLLLLDLWTHRGQRRVQIQQIVSTWLPLAALYGATMVGYWYNRRGGGTYYFNPWIVWLCLVCLKVWVRYSGRLRLLTGIAVVGVGLGTANWPNIYHQGMDLYLIQPAASHFRHQLESLDQESPILSEDAFFFKKDIRGVTIDSGDTVEGFSSQGFGTPEFRKFVSHYFSTLESHPPKYVYMGGIPSSKLSQLVSQKYRVLLTSPPCMQSNGPRPTYLYIRND